MQWEKVLPRYWLPPTKSLSAARDISDVIEITKPVEIEWEWSWLKRLADQSIIIEPNLSDSEVWSLRFKSRVVVLPDRPAQAMLIMSPDAGNLDELTGMNLTVSDLPVHGDYREAMSHVLTRTPELTDDFGIPPRQTM